MTNRVLITGANRGIGLALCKEYLSRGDQVIAVCRNVSSEISALPVQLIADVDITAKAGVEKLQSELVDTSLDILINNAGILRSSSLEELNFEQVIEQFMVNALAPLKLVSSLRRHLQKGSKIAMITSRMGSIADNSSGGSYGYRMSKSALNAASKSLAIDLKPEGIHVALLHPGYVSTEMVNWHGEIQPELSAQRLALRIDQLNATNTGTFWHANGEILPW